MLFLFDFTDVLFGDALLWGAVKINRLRGLKRMKSGEKQLKTCVIPLLRLFFGENIKLRKLCRGGWCIYVRVMLLKSSLLSFSLL